MTRQSAEENAALIAEHLEAAGDLHAAYGWHMRAATWATNRDISAARLSVGSVPKRSPTHLPAEDPHRATMRIAPRTMLCGTAWRVHVNVAGDRFDELRELCTAAGDKASLAIGMAGLVTDYGHQGRMREASRLASEAMTVIESVGDPTLTVGLSFAAIHAKMESGEFGDVLRLSQTVIDLADGDPSKGNFIFGSPLAVAFASGLLPGITWVVRDGEKTCGTAWPWPAAPTLVLRHGRHACLLHGDTDMAVLQARRFRDARHRGCATDCRTIR